MVLIILELTFVYVTVLLYSNTETVLFVISPIAIVFAIGWDFLALTTLQPNLPSAIIYVALIFTTLCSLSMLLIINPFTIVWLI